MNTSKLGGRQLKQKIRGLLKQSPPDTILELLLALPARQVINPLISFLYSTDMLIKWQAVMAIGAVVARLADTNPESARVIMRRLMWNLNDESGGIGWGSPEAMGAIIRDSHLMATEYTDILISYIQPGGNFLETTGLQQGALWAVGHVAHARPHKIEHAAVHLVRFMGEADPMCRGLAAWAAGPMRAEITRQALENLTRDTHTIHLFIDGCLVERPIDRLASASLLSLGPR